MERHPHTTDAQGFDYMANSGQEEKDRVYVGSLLALLIMLFITVTQYHVLL